jgi:type VI secretion system ImpA family protein
MIDELLQPISADKPSGDDQSGEPEWQAIKEARRADDKFDRGSWDRVLKESDWHAVKELSVELLSKKTKDLRLAIFLTEANLNLNAGFAGLAESLRFIRELIANFWNAGLHPLAEDGDLEYRAQALDWLGASEKLPAAIREIPLTKRSGGARNYSWTNFDDARGVGWEKDLRNKAGDLDEAKARKRETDLASGHISREMFEEAVASTSRKDVESISNDLDAAWTEYLALVKEIDDKFGDKGPGLQDARESFEECRNLVADTLKKKREQEPDPSLAMDGVQPGENQGAGSGPDRFSFMDDGFESSGGGSWQAAENLIRAGNAKEGLAAMAKLAASEHGRVRFHRKLRLAETYFSLKRDRLALSILEELAKEIDEHHLETWESTALVGQVWGRLYRCYKSDEEHRARGVELFDRLCRLDPWQVLRWDD